MELSESQLDSRLATSPVPNEASASLNLIDGTWTVIDSTNDDQLEAWLLFCIAVAGKTARTTATAVNRFLVDRGPLSPLAYVWQLDESGFLIRRLRDSRMGQYHKLYEAYSQAAHTLNADVLRTCTIEDLEKIHGIGPKTSRFFVQSTREGTQYGVLDTHILAWMRELGYDVPKSTPTGKRYLDIERKFLLLAKSLKMTPQQLDAKIWSSRRR